MEEKLKGLMTFGVKRIRYSNYIMENALEIVYKIGKSIIPGFILTPHTKELYIKLIQYFYADNNFPGDLTKGLLLQGPTGTGKTKAMEIMSIFLEVEKIGFYINGKCARMNYSTENVKNIVIDFIANGFDGPQSYINKFIYCFDDLGTENRVAKHFGNELDVIRHIFVERYAKGRLTFATTNYSIDKLEEKYGDPILSRMNAMFNFIVVKGPDFRKE
jgi:hypothetical protein